MRHEKIPFLVRKKKEFFRLHLPDLTANGKHFSIYKIQGQGQFLPIDAVYDACASHQPGILRMISSKSSETFSQQS